VGVFGNTIRLTVAIFFILIFRQFSQFFVSEPVPVGMIWHYPGFPSLIVTYYTTFDFFFSGHTASATLSALEIGHRGYKRKIFVIVAIMLVMMEIFCILSMRFHYTADVITGIFAAVTAFVLAQKVTPALDRPFQEMIERLSA
jgi:membrane-associated phospholipid phosphatase